MSNVIGLCAGFCGVVLFTYLLRSGAIGSGSYATLVIATILAAIAISRIELLEALDLKNLRVTLREIQQVRSDIYAKAELVKHMGEELAQLVVFNVNSVGRFAPNDLDEQMVQARNKIGSVLKDIGTDPQKVAEIIQPINDTVLRDVKREVTTYLQQQLASLIMRKGSPVLWDHVKDEFQRPLDNYDRQTLIERAKHYEIYSPDMETHLDRLERFIKNKTL